MRLHDPADGRHRLRSRLRGHGEQGRVAHDRSDELKRRHAALGLALALALALAGCGPFSGHELKSPPADARSAGPSGLVRFGDHALFVHCTGRGPVTVVLEGGVDMDVSAWEPVQGRVASYARVCSYNRAGLRPSRPGPLPRTSSRLVGELRALLDAARVRGPYVLVGTSFGGLNVQLFARRYRRDTAGVVLVNSLHPEFDRQLDAILPPDVARDRRTRLRPSAEGIRFRDVLASEREVAAVRSLDNLPLIVLQGPPPFMGVPAISGRVTAMWSAQQRQLAALSSRGTREVAPAPSPDLVASAPELVDRAIRRVLDMSGH